MKRLIQLFLVVMICAIASSESNAQGKNSPEYIRQLNVYKKAKFYNDPITARYALYNLIELDPADASLMDSLAYEYYSFRQFTSALIVTLEALKRDGNNLSMLELKAICWENIGDKNKALDSYESLFLKNNSSVTLYKIAFLQLDLKRYAEATTSADILLGKTDISDIEITFGKKDETTQNVPLKAAVHNLKGLIAKDQGNTTEAKSQFQKAIDTSPGFEVALTNLTELDG